MEQASAPPPAEDFSARYWRCLYEFKRRRFGFAPRRLCETILDLSIGEGYPDVEIPSIEVLAEATFCTPNNLHPVIRALTEACVLGREARRRTWWLNEIDLWKRLRCDDDATDQTRATSAMAALTRIRQLNRLRSNQGELYPLPPTDAEVAAEGHQARASDWTATELPSAVAPPPPLGEVRGEPDSLKIRLESLKFRLQKSENQMKGSENQTVFAVQPTGTPPRARPGNLVNTCKEIPGIPGGERTTGNRWQLDHAGWSLVRDLEAFCREGGDLSFNAAQARQWQWRVWKNPLRVEMFLRETMAHVRESRRPIIQSRAGWIKHLWSQEEKRDAAPRTPEEEALALRVRQEGEKHFGKGGA